MQYSLFYYKVYLLLTIKFALLSYVQHIILPFSVTFYAGAYFETFF